MILDNVQNAKIGFIQAPGPPHIAVVTVEMDYLPTLSVNCYRTVRGLIRSEVRKWQEQLGWAVKSLLINSKNMLNNFDNVNVKIAGDWSGKGRRPDMHNFRKVVDDAVKEGVGIDDQYFTTSCDQWGRGPKKLIITIQGRYEPRI